MSTLRLYSREVNRRYIDDEGDWFYSSEWWDCRPSIYNTVFRDASHFGNGFVSVLSHPSSKPVSLYMIINDEMISKRDFIVFKRV